MLKIIKWLFKYRTIYKNKMQFELTYKLHNHTHLIYFKAKID